MPYIKEEDRGPLENLCCGRIKTTGAHLKDAGQLNYFITRIIIGYFRSEGKGNYQAINDIVGALESAKAEFQRRIVGPYENSKISGNGDVY